MSEHRKASHSNVSTKRFKLSKEEENSFLALFGRLSKINVTSAK